MNESLKLIAGIILCAASTLSPAAGRTRSTTVETDENDASDPFLYYPKAVEYKGGIRSWSAYSPTTQRQSSQNNLFAKGHLVDLPMEMAASLESYEGISRFRDAFLDLGRPSLQLRLGDFSRGLAGFRNQVETRRGMRLAGESESAVWSGQYSPASLNDHWGWQALAPRSILGVEAALGGRQASMAGSLERSVYENATGGSSLGALKAGLAIPMAGALSIAGAISQPDEQGNSRLARAGRILFESSHGMLGGRVLVERTEEGFVSMGDPRLYAGRRNLEIQPRLNPGGTWQPYLGYSSEDVELAAPGQPQTINRQTAGIQGFPNSWLQFDLSGSREFRVGQAWRQGGAASMSLQGQGADRIYAMVSLEHSLTPLPADEWNGLWQAGHTLTDTWDALWTSSPHMFESQDGSGNSFSWLNSLEMAFRSWDESWGFRIMAGLQLQRAGGSQMVHDLSGLAGLTLGWEGWSFQPEARLSQLRMEDARSLNYGWNIRLSRDFSFGASPISAQVQGTVFEDSNHNRQMDPGEPGVAGVEILLDGQTMAISDESGRFSAENLVPEIHDLALNWDSVPAQYQAETIYSQTVDLRLERKKSLYILLNRR